MYRTHLTDHDYTHSPLPVEQDYTPQELAEWDEDYTPGDVTQGRGTFTLTLTITGNHAYSDPTYLAGEVRDSLDWLTPEGGHDGILEMRFTEDRDLGR